MFLFIIFGILLAKGKGNSVLVSLKKFDLYPLFFVEAVYIALQAVTLSGNYALLKYAGILQAGFILSLLPAIVRRKLAAPACAGACCVIFGTVLNKIAMQANGGKMPVYPTISRWTGYYKDGILEQGLDSVHTLLTSSSRLPFLADFIDTGFSIMSIGDLLIHSFVTIIVFYTIQKMNGEKRK